MQPPAKIICTSLYCDIDPGICTIGDSDGWDSGGLKRSEDSLNGTHLNYLEGRGSKRFFDIAMTVYTTYRLWSRAYPSRGTLFETALAWQQVLRQFLRPTPTPTDCGASYFHVLLPFSSIKSQSWEPGNCSGSCDRMTKQPSAHFHSLLPNSSRSLPFSVAHIAN